MPVSFDSTDLDNAASETGVVHESVANTDHDNASVLKQGYQIANPYLSADLVGYWPLQEDSGTTAYDFSGNNNDGTVNGATLNQTGLLGTSAYSFDGADDEVHSTGYSHPDAGDFSISCWFNTSASATGNPIVSTWTSDAVGILFGVAPSGNTPTAGHIGLRIRASNTNQKVFETDNTFNDGSWHYVTLAWDNSSESATFYVDGSDVPDSKVNDQGSLDSIDSGDDMEIGHSSDRGTWYGGSLASVRVDETLLSLSEHQTLHDVVNTQGEIITSSKVA